MDPVKPLTFEELMLRSLDHAHAAEEQLQAARDAWNDPETREQGLALEAIGVAQGQAQISALLAESYARLASALVVNRTSLNAAVEAPRQGRVS